MMRIGKYIMLLCMLAFLVHVAGPGQYADVSIKKFESRIVPDTSTAILPAVVSYSIAESDLIPRFSIIPETLFASGLSLNVMVCPFPSRVPSMLLNHFPEGIVRSASST